MPKARNSDEGWALASVLWTVTLLSMLAVAAQDLALSSFRMERKLDAAVRVGADFDAGLARAVVALISQDREQRWPVDGTPQRFAFDGSEYSIKIEDEQGKLDLNASDPSLLRRLFQACGASEQRAREVANNLIAWRSATVTGDNVQYEGRSYHPRHGALPSIGEFSLVAGMTPQLFKCLAPAVTVYTHRPMADPMTAPAPVLAALGESDEDIAAKMQRRLSRNAPPPEMATPGRTFSVQQELRLNAHTYRRNTVVMMTGDQSNPYMALYSD